MAPPQFAGMVQSILAPAIRGRSEQIVVVCAYCDRMRTPSGEWQPSGAVVRSLLQHGSDVLVSHGCCPECLEREMAKCRVGSGTAGWRARRW